MITNLPLYVYLTFFGSVILVLVQFYFASGKNMKLILALLCWGTLHSTLAVAGFYENTMSMPPRFFLLALLVPAVIISSSFSSKMKTWLVSLDLKQLTYLNVVRIPVELVLFWLFVGGYVPELMTFEGRNFDIIMGITAPLVAIAAFRGSEVKKTLLYVWNIISLILLGNIVIHAILSGPTVLQLIAFDQPNVALFYFPFLLLPAIIVPLVLIANIGSLMILSKKGDVI